MVRRIELHRPRESIGDQAGAQSTLDRETLIGFDAVPGVSLTRV